MPTNDRPTLQEIIAARRAKRLELEASMQEATAALVQGMDAGTIDSKGRGFQAVPGQWYVMDRMATTLAKAYVAGPFPTFGASEVDRLERNIAEDCESWRDERGLLATIDVAHQADDSPARTCPSCHTGYLGGYPGMRCTNGACDRPIVVEVEAPGTVAGELELSSKVGLRASGSEAPRTLPTSTRARS